MKKLLNIDYSCIHASYWMAYGAIVSFASVYLLAMGYSNSRIGLILAISNVLAAVLQPFIADFADRSRKISLFTITQLLTLLIIILSAGIFFIKGRSTVLSLIFIMIICWHTVLHPLLNFMTFKVEECGVHINFGISRSCGSLAYSVFVAVLGILVERYGTISIPVGGELSLLFLIVSLLFIKQHFSKSVKNQPSEQSQSRLSEPDCEEITLRRFIATNRLFFIMSLGILGLYFSNAVLNCYMIQIVSDVGGTSEDMGIILSIMAFLEIPTMVLFDYLRKKFTCQSMLKVASVGFTAKIAMCFMAQSVAMIIAAQFLQIISFALFLPAMVHFINEIMYKSEAVKGQALFTTMVTVATIFSSLTGGVILDLGSPKLLTLISTVITALGAVIIFAVVDKIKSN